MHDAVMRTTLTIDDDVLAAARALADHQARPIGEVISDLARQALKPRGSRVRNGVLLLPDSGDRTPITTEIVNQLRDELP